VSVDVERRSDGRVETWWLNRPASRNALSLEMWASLVENSTRVTSDLHVRVVVIRGRGHHFSAGADIVGLGRALAADTTSSSYRATNAAAESAVASLPMPVIAAIDGACIGGGVQLALACDLRIATTRASFAVTPAKLGIAYPASAVQRLVAIVGPARASELLLTGDTIDAATALEHGVVTRVVDDLEASVNALIATLIERSPFTQAASKAVIGRLVASRPIDDLTTSLELASLEHGDLDEGLSAFAEKRPPRFGDRNQVR